jgi:hypothetical protein
MGQIGRASEFYTKAFQLREHVSERERLRITLSYYANVTGEVDKVAQTCQEESKPTRETGECIGNWATRMHRRASGKRQ